MIQVVIGTKNVRSDSDDSSTETGKDIRKAFFYSKTYNYLDTVGEVTNLASGGGTELPLSEMSTYFSTLL